VVLAVIAVGRAGGLGELSARLPATMFSWHGVGFAQICAWMLAGVGATFATQYVVQAITTVGDDTKAQRAGFYSALVLVPYGLLAALIGVCAAMLFPGIKSIQAMPVLIAQLNPLLAGLVVAGLAGAMFGTIAALNIGASTLLFKDFYQPYFNTGADERKNMRFIRLAAVLAGLLPIVLALYASDVLAVTFLAKALRATLAVLVLLMFYAPRYGTRGGAFWTIIIALVATIGWFLAGSPWGIDEAYVAVLVPLVVMPISHVVRRRDPAEPTPAPSSEAVSR
jgi:SSS family solute:Na+ symporter